MKGANSILIFEEKFFLLGILSRPSSAVGPLSDVIRPGELHILSFMLDIGSLWHNPPRSS